MSVKEIVKQCFTHDPLMFSLIKASVMYAFLSSLLIGWNNNIINEAYLPRYF